MNEQKPLLGDTLVEKFFEDETFFEMHLYLLVGSKIFGRSDHQQNHHPSRCFSWNHPQLPHEDASWCFAGAASGTIYVWLASTGSLLRYWPAHFREVFCLETFSRNLQKWISHVNFKGQTKLTTCGCLRMSGYTYIYINIYLSLSYILSIYTGKIRWSVVFSKHGGLTVALLKINHTPAMYLLSLLSVSLLGCPRKLVNG